MPCAETTSLLPDLPLPVGLGSRAGGLGASAPDGGRQAAGAGSAAARPFTASRPANTSACASPSGAEVTMAAGLARLGLRSVKQVRVQFCPFEKDVESTRYAGEGVRTGRGAPSSRRGLAPLGLISRRLLAAGPSSRR